MSSQSPYRAAESPPWQNQPQVDTSPDEPSHPHEPSLHADASTQDTQSRNEAALVQGPTIAPPVARKRPLPRVLALSALLRWSIILVGILLAIGGILLISNVALPPGPYRGDQGKALFFETLTVTPQGGVTPATTYYILGLGDKQHDYLITPEHNYWINPADFNGSAPTPEDLSQATSVTVIYRPDKDNTFLHNEGPVQVVGQIQVFGGSSLVWGSDSFAPIHEAVQITLSEGNGQKVYTSTEYNGYIQTRQRDIQTRQIIGVALLIPGLLIALLAFVVPIIVRRTTRKQTALNIAPEVATGTAIAVEIEPQSTGYPGTVAVTQRENGFQRNPEPASPGSPMIPKEWILLHTLGGHTDGVLCVAISPDGQTLVSGSEDKTIKLWNLQTGELLRTLTGHADGVLCVVISPDGQTLASGSGDETIKLWNLLTGELLRTLTGHADTVFSIAISPDGQTLASGSGDETIKLWNLQSGKLLQALTGHTGDVFSVAISPDGQILASGGVDHTIKIWRMYPPVPEFTHEVRGGTTVAAGQGSSPEYDPAVLAAPSEHTAYGTQSSYVPPAQTQYGSAAQQEYASSLLQQSSTPAPPSYQSSMLSAPSQPSVSPDSPGAIPTYGVAPPPQPAYPPPSQQKKPRNWLRILKKPGGWWGIALIAVAALVVLGGVGMGAFLLLWPQLQPVISVTSDYKVGSTPAGAIGTVFHVNGQQFSNNSTITFLLDGKPVPGELSMQSDANGKVWANLTVTEGWTVGKHTLTARDADKHITKVGVPVVIVAQGQAHTLGPNGAPPDDLSFSLKVTIEHQDATTGEPLASLDETLTVTGGTVCQSRDNGQPQTYTGNFDSYRGSITYTETIVYECSGTYQGGKLSYTETATSVRFTMSVGSSCELNSPVVYQQLEGTFSNQNTMSGSEKADGFSVPCSGGGISSLDFNGENGTWTGTLA